MEPFKYNKKNQTFESHLHLVTLYEFSGYQVTNTTDNLVITSLRFREDVDSGDALWIDLTLEEVQFATLEAAELPKDVSQKLKKAAQSEKNKGKVDSTKQDLEKSQQDKNKDAPESDIAVTKQLGGAVNVKIVKPLLGLE
ncbi:hypothetical protein D3C85_1108180 [compost metagenome]